MHVELFHSTNVFCRFACEKWKELKHDNTVLTYYAGLMLTATLLSLRRWDLASTTNPCGR